MYWLLRATQAGSGADVGAEGFAAAADGLAVAAAEDAAAAGDCARQTEDAATRPAARTNNETAVRHIGRSPEKGIQPAYGLACDLEQGKHSAFQEQMLMTEKYCDGPAPLYSRDSVQERLQEQSAEEGRNKLTTYPRGLKPYSVCDRYRRAEARPFQGRAVSAGTYSEQNKMTENYLHDLGILIKQNGLEVRRELETSLEEKRAFWEGKLLAYNEVLSLIISQAQAFGLDPSILGLGDFDPDTDL